MARRQEPDLPLLVREGIRYLDRHTDKVGERWWEKIDLASLEMSNVYSCVLGQLLGEVTRGRHQLGLARSDADALGFSLPAPSGTADYAPLTAEWKTQITKLRETRMDPDNRSTETDASPAPGEIVEQVTELLNIAVRLQKLGAQDAAIAAKQRAQDLIDRL